MRCSVNGQRVDSQVTISPNQWRHVGCTYDGHNLLVYIDGDVSNCYDVSLTATTGTIGMMVGAPFFGGVDNVHVISRAVSDAEMCAHAGKSGCNTSCPSGGGGGGSDS